MFIHEMTIDECYSALQKASVGRLGCALNNQPYVVPINFAFDGSCLYGFTTLGQKVEWLRANPLVSFEIDEVTGHNNWMSIILFGRYEELPDKAEYEKPRIKGTRYCRSVQCGGSQPTFHNSIATSPIL